MRRDETAQGDRNGLTVAAFVAMVVGIGGNVVSVRFIAREQDIAPLWAASSRFFVATLIFVAIAMWTRAALPKGRALVGAVLYGTLSIGAFFALMYLGLQKTPAVVAGVILATTPLLTLVFAIAHGQERFRWDSLIGGGAAVAGTAVMLGGASADGTPIASALAIVAASACAAEGGVVVKGFPRVAPAARNAIGMGVGTVILTSLMFLRGEDIGLPAQTGTWIAQLYLVTFGTVGVFALYLFVLSRWSASATSYEFVLTPVIGITLAALLLDEQITTRFVVGSAIVLTGVYFGALRPAREAKPG